MALLTAQAIGLTVRSTSGMEQRVLCPFHSDVHSSASYNIAKQLFYCHTCKLGLTVRALLTKMGREVDEELLTISEQSTEFVFDMELDDPTRLFGRSFYPGLGNEDQDTVHAYLTVARRLTPPIIEQYTEYVTKPLGPLIPILDMNERRVGAMIRPITTTFGRYILVGQRTPLWPLNEIQYEHATLLIVEGIFSCIRLKMAASNMKLKPNDLGIYALLGSRVTADTFELVDQIETEEVLFCFDRDSAGYAGATAVKRARSYRTAVIAPSPDDMTDDQLVRFLTKVMHS